MESKLSGELYLKKILPFEEKLWPMADRVLPREYFTARLGHVRAVAGSLPTSTLDMQ